MVEFEDSLHNSYTRFRLYGPGVDMPLAIEEVDPVPPSLGIIWTLTDHQGTVCDLAGHWVDGTFRVEHVQYTAFGVPAIPGGLPGAVRTFYAGRDLDRFTGLYNNRARWYDAGAGRFISEDPIGFAGGDANLYRYCGNSPTNATDPSGHFLNFIAGAIGAGVGTVLGAGGYALNCWLTGAEFSWSEMGLYAGAGAVAGGLAGLTFGASLAMTGMAGTTTTGIAGVQFSAGTALFTAGATSGMVGGAASGFITGTGESLMAGRGLGESLRTGGQQALQGAAYGGIGGAVGGAVAGRFLGTFAGEALSGFAGGAAEDLLSGGLDAYAASGGSLAAALQGSLQGGLRGGIFGAGVGAGIGAASRGLTRMARSGGRLGSASTRAQVAEIQAELESRRWTVQKGGTLGEEYIPGPGNARAGSAYPDITAIKNGRTLRINTIDTLSDGLTPTAREAANAAKIRSLRSNDHLLLVPKQR